VAVGARATATALEFSLLLLPVVLVFVGVLGATTALLLAAGATIALAIVFRTRLSQAPRDTTALARNFLGPAKRCDRGEPCSQLWHGRHT